MAAPHAQRDPPGGTRRGRLERAATALPLRTSFLLVLVLFAVALGALLMPAQFHDASRVGDEHALATLGNQVNLFRAQLERAPLEPLSGKVTRQFGAPSDDPMLRAALVVSSKGTVLDAAGADLAGLEVREALRRKGESEMLAAEIEDVRVSGTTRARVEGDRAIVLCPIAIQGHPVLLVIRSLEAARSAARAETLRDGAALALALLALGAALWTWLELLLERRVRRVVDAAARFAANDLDARARLSGNDELAAIGRAFDAMADSVAQARVRLRDSEERVRLLLESTGDALCGIDLEGRTTFCNPAALRLFGLDNSAELVGHPFYDSLRKESAEPLEKDFVDALIRTDARIELELAISRSDASLVPVYYSAGPLLLQGKLVGRVVTLTDLTDKKRGEDQLRKSQAQLRIADRLATVGTLSAGVAHEINNPLAYTLANLGYVADCLRQLPEGAGDLDTAELRAAVAEAIEGAERVRRIVKDMKTLSRVDDERIGAVDVERALDASINMALHEVRHKANVVKDYGAVGHALANEGRLVQVFLNLLVNAAQAIPEGHPEDNEVRIATCVDGERRIAVEISDTGTGIPEEVLPRIFDPFFTTKPLGVGTGLGLSICHSLISSIGGQIEVASKVGVGTRFLIVLPPYAQDTDALQHA